VKMWPKVILLDFDGVIIESVGIKDRAFAELYRDYPRHFSQIMEYHHSHNATIRFTKFQYIAENILKEFYNSQKEKELSKKFSNLVFDKLVLCPYVKGAVDFLEFFSKQVPLYLISISPEEELLQVLNARILRDYFKKVYANPPSKSEAFRKILTNEQIDASESVYIGDTPEDYQAATTTGIPFIGRKSKKAFPGRGFPVFEDMLEVQRYLNKLEVKKNSIQT
jgi:HAD superfamily hydrolase (TIGR01549 family)